MKIEAPANHREAIRDLYGGLLLGVLLLIAGIMGILTGGGNYRGFTIPSWGCWGLFITGILITPMAARAILRKRKTLPPVGEIAAEAVKAKAELDAMYFKEHGKMPEKPKDE